MTTTPFDPFREIDRLFNQAGRASAQDNRAMPLDLYRADDKFIIKMDLPGVDPGSIDIDVDDRTLTIRAQRHVEELDTSKENNVWVTRERSSGTYARQIALGTGLDTSGIEASYRDGVLTVEIPVAAEATPRKIAVRTDQPAIDG